MISISDQIANLDWPALSTMLDKRGYALTQAVLPPEQCQELAYLYDRNEGFRSTVIMARHGFGKGQYRYFSYPLPPIVDELRRALYPHLANIANNWAARLGQQDLYGPIHFPLQAVVMLSAPDAYSGGALTLVENRPRMQSRVEVIPITQGQIAIIPVRDRPRQAANGWSRSTIRHGVSTILSGRRQTLGIIFHDAS